jgi:hypothetical protein
MQVLKEIEQIYLFDLKKVSSLCLCFKTAVAIKFVSTSIFVYRVSSRENFIKRKEDEDIFSVKFGLY